MHKKKETRTKGEYSKHAHRKKREEKKEVRTERATLSRGGILTIGLYMGFH